jgi:hypothetical protein
MDAMDARWSSPQSTPTTQVGTATRSTLETKRTALAGKWTGGTGHDMTKEQIDHGHQAGS